MDASISGEFGRIMAWADKYRVLKVRTNADNPRDTAQAVKFGAEGIGLCLSLIHISGAYTACRAPR